MFNLVNQNDLIKYITIFRSIESHYPDFVKHFEEFNHGENSVNASPLSLDSKNSQIFLIKKYL